MSPAVARLCGGVPNLKRDEGMLPSTSSEVRPGDRGGDRVLYAGTRGEGGGNVGDWTG